MTELKKFTYEQLDETTAEFLRKKESNMREIVGKAYTELGRELKEAQEALKGSRYDGVFEQWYTKMGWKKRTVYNLIDRFTEVQKLHDGDLREIFEELPVTLSYKISGSKSESTPAKAQAKAEVLSGEIDTLKAYKGRIKELEQAKEMAEQQAKAERKERERLEAQEPEVRTEYVEVEKFPQDYEDLRKENETYRRLYGDSCIYDGDTRRVSDGDAITYTVLEFTEDIRNFIEKYGYLTHFPKEFEQMIPEGKERFKASINKLAQFLSGVEQAMDDEEIIIFEQ